jgi:hypothetical protein
LYLKFYRLPDTEEEQTELYQRQTGDKLIHGLNFQYKLCALVFLRMKNLGYNFKLGSNVEGLGKFDDVVVEYLDDNSRKKHVFVQLKSKLRCTITLLELLGKKRKGNVKSKCAFSLRKYYETYNNFNCGGEEIKMEGSTDENLFIIYTNADVEENLKSKKVTDIGEERFLMTGGSVLQFNKEEHPVIYQHMQDLPKHHEFLSRFRICYSQANEKEMDWHIKSELQQIMKLPER